MIGRWKLLQEIKPIQINTYPHYTEFRKRNRDIKANYSWNEIMRKGTSEFSRINRVTKNRLNE